MTISGISDGYAPPQLDQFSSTQQSSGIGRDSDGDNDGSRASGASGGSGGPGAFLDAIFQALSQVGVSGNTATMPARASTSSTAADTPPSQNPLQALGTFMHDLLTALLAKGNHAASQGGSDSDGDNDGSASSGVSGASGTHRHHGRGLAQIESNLQSLIQQLSSSSSSSPATGSAATASSANSSATLQQDYQNLLSSLGASGNPSTLGSFLQALSESLQNIGSSGNLINTQV
jgi:hypothetical protein